jgi:hypothetical protein
MLRRGVGAAIVLTTMLAADAAEARREPFIRSGLAVTASAGAVRIDYDELRDGETLNGVELQVGAGWSVMPRLTLLGEVGMTFTDKREYETRRMVVDAVARWFFTEAVYAQAGLGLGWYRIEYPQSDFQVVDLTFGPTVTAAIGVDALRREQIAMGLQLRGNVTSHGEDGTVWQFGLALVLGWY